MKNRKIAVITGGGKRLGKHITLALAEKGFDIAFTYNTSREGALKTIESVKNLGRDVLAAKTDSRKIKEVHRFVEKVKQQYGRIDVLVNNSAIFTESKLEDITEELWDNTIDTNLKGTFLFSQAVAPVMLKQKKGRIITIASLGGVQAWRNHLAYNVSKAGVIMLNRCLAKSLAPYIYVNAIAPGTIDMDEPASTTSLVSPDTIPLRRYGKPTDISSMVVYLATTAEYITGQTFIIDGGRAI